MKLLFVDACVSQRGAESRTRKLASAFLEGYREGHPGSTIQRVDVAGLGLMPLTPEDIVRRDAAESYSGPEFQVAQDFRTADQIVVAAPFWDLSFPAILRVYIEHISVCGLCYHYDEAGCHGDCKANRLAYLTTGGDFEKPDSLGPLYWKQLAKMFGIPRYDYLFAGGLDIAPERVPEILKPVLEQARKLGREF